MRIRIFLHKNICCGCSLELPHRGGSNGRQQHIRCDSIEYPQRLFLWRTEELFLNYHQIPSLSSNTLIIIKYPHYHRISSLSVSLINWQMSEWVQCPIQSNNYRNDPKFSDRNAWANSADQGQTAPRAVWSGSSLFSIPSAPFGLITLW